MGFWDDWMIWMMVCDSAHADLDVFGLTWGNQNSGLTSLSCIYIPHAT